SETLTHLASPLELMAHWQLLEIKNDFVLTPARRPCSNSQGLRELVLISGPKVRVAPIKSID
ncbi:MAG: hypothetical protein WB677_05705, partial [Xanthobacteraceae bacterium]